MPISSISGKRYTNINDTCNNDISDIVNKQKNNHIP